jgi:hypothetical protein
LHPSSGTCGGLKLFQVDRMDLAHHLDMSAFFFSDRPCVRHADIEMTYARLNEQYRFGVFKALDRDRTDMAASPGMRRHRAVIHCAKPGMTIIPQEAEALSKCAPLCLQNPEEVLVVDEMPKNHAGKILKRELKKTFRQGNG